MDQYKPGQQVIYEETGTREIAEVLENNCDWIKYKLKTLKKINGSMINLGEKGAIFLEPDGGKEFIFTRKRGIDSMTLGKITGLA